MAYRVRRQKAGMNSPGLNAGHLSVVELLIKRRANVAAADRKGNTALDLAQDEAVRAALQAALQELKGHQKAEKPTTEVTPSAAF